MKRGQPMRRTPMARGSAPLPRTPMARGGKRIPQRSATKARVGAVGSDSAADVIGRSGGICERCKVVPGTDLHHRVTRARGGPGDAFNLVHLCKACHGIAHADNEWPWLVPGRFIRGVYTGPDEAYREHYGAPC